MSEEQKVSFIKMSNGEEFVAVVMSEGEVSITVTNPVILQQQRDANGQVQSGFLPWCAFAKARTIELMWTEVMFVVEAGDNIAEAYNEMFNDSKIIKPNAPSIITG